MPKDEWEERYKQWKAEREQEKLKEERRKLEEAGKAKDQTPITNYLRKEEKAVRDEIRSITSNIKEGVKKVENNIEKDIKLIDKESKENPFVVKGLIFLAFAIPVAILLYFLYINFLPFGYSETYTLQINEQGIISPLSDEIYLTNTQGRKLLSLPNGVQGQVNLVLKPGVVIKNATINVSITGNNVYLATPLNLNLSEIQWDYDWDFTEGVPSDFQGTAEFDPQEGCVRFDAYKEQTLSLPNSEDMFEEGPMSIYVKWKPSLLSQQLGNGQQILGHYNWEIRQSKDNVGFNIKNKPVNKSEKTYSSVLSGLDSNFFGKEHELLAVYSPSERGYTELWVDDELNERVSMDGDTISQDYNGKHDLSLGWNDATYGLNPYFDGCLYDIKIANKIISQQSTKNIILASNKQETVIPILGQGNLSSINLELVQ